MTETFDIVILGLAITSSWGNGHATTYRGLVKGLAARGHNVLFLERDAEWYASNRDEPHPAGVTVTLYTSLEDLVTDHEKHVRDAELVIVGSYVPQGIEIGEWVLSIANGKCAFYDIDTPVTMSLLEANSADYISAGLIKRYAAYFSFSSGPILNTVRNRYGSPLAQALYCVVDQDIYAPVSIPICWDLGYLGTYSSDRQPGLDQLLTEPARRWQGGRFAVAGPQYPEGLRWPSNLSRFTHLSSHEHPAFYGSQRFTLNVTREPMKAAGHSPSVRLFEAAACGVPIISDWWNGLDDILAPNREVLVAKTAEDTLRFLRDIDEAERKRLGERGRARVLAEHSPQARALQVEKLLEQMNENDPSRAARRNRRVRQIFSGIDTQLPSESKRPESGAKSSDPAVTLSYPGHLYESA